MQNNDKVMCTLLKKIHTIQCFIKSLPQDTNGCTVTHVLVVFDLMRMWDMAVSLRPGRDLRP